MKIADIMEKQGKNGTLPDFILLSGGFGGIFQFSLSSPRGNLRRNISLASFPTVQASETI